MPSLSDRSATISAMTDAATAAAVASCDARMIGASPYYNTAYPAANYGMYAAGTSNYYPVPSPLRASATSFPFTAPHHPYYGGSYSSTAFDYATYPASIQCYSNRNGYYAHPINTSSSPLYAVGALSAEMMPSAQLPSFSTKNETRKPSKSAKRKKSVAATFTPVDHYTRVFIWEMEDVCVLSNFFLRSSDPLRGQRLAHTVNTNINSFIAVTFGIESSDVIECDQMNIEDTAIDELSNELPFLHSALDTPSLNQQNVHSSASQNTARGGIDWMRRLAAKYQHVKETYAMYKDNYKGLIERSGILSNRSELLAFKNTIDPLTQGWTDSIGRCLKLIVERSSRDHYANVLITSESITSTLAKLLVMEQSAVIPAENVYSTLKVSKESILDRIVSRFGKKCSFVIISTHSDTHEIAKKENMPLWKIRSVRDLELFHIALTHHLLS